MAVIELPSNPAPNGVVPRLIDYGFTMRSPTGGSSLRLDRAGSRFAVEVSYPPMKADKARVFVSRLLEAKSQGLRIEFPLLGVSQGNPGTPVVDGAGQAGKTLSVRGLTPGYVVKEGYWLSIVDADGQHYLHNATAVVTADAGGLASLSITPALRVPFADGAVIHLAKPMIEGLVDGNEWSWQLPVNRLIALAVTIEEAG
jgi:hypothetical protein